MVILELNRLMKNFGGVAALNLDLHIDEGEIFGLVGPNGSGKTTCINLVTGFLKPTSGDIRYKGESIAGLKPYQIAKRNIIRTFQLSSVFSNLTVTQNIIVARYLKTKHGSIGSFLRSIFNTKDYVKEEKNLAKKADEILSILKMKDKGSIIASKLPSVDQRKLEIAIALACEPELLLLDEPAAGMNPEEVDRLMTIIQSLNMSGITILIVEHNMEVVTGICTRATVISYGVKIAEGTPDEIINNEQVIACYLGEELSA